jgi:RimJ/RimL family protein N-acetyltransferase
MRAAPTLRLRFDPVQAGDASRLATFLASSDWPYHHERRVEPVSVLARWEAGYFFGDEARSFWIAGEDGEPLGLARVFDLKDATPLFDLRIGADARGRGIGTLALRGLTTWVFSELPELGRFGGYTRHDNAAMRRVFEKCGFLQEARHRKAWPVPSGEAVDAVGYAILREEAERL